MRQAPKILALALILFPVLALAQDPKQQINDQMWEAVRKGDVAAVKEALNKGADVNAKFRYGTTALFKAAERGYVEVVNLLLERGADVKVKDTFYGATAMSWALQNNHIEAVRALLKKSPDDVDDVLLTGARGGESKLVTAALEQGGAKAETLTLSLAAATTGETKNAEIAELLKKAGAVAPPQIDVAILQTYVGTYKPERGPNIVLSVKDGNLVATPAGQRPITLIATDKISFRPRDFDGLSIIMTIESDKATGLTLKQGATPSVYKRVEETQP